MPRINDPWTEEKRQLLVQMKLAKVPMSEICLALNRTPNQINVYIWRRRKLGDPLISQIPKIPPGAHRRGRTYNHWKPAPIPSPIPAPEPTVYIDEQGRTVKRYPPAYAMGTDPKVTARSRGRTSGKKGR